MLWLRSMPCQATLRWITLPKASWRPLVKDIQEDWRLPGLGNCVSIVCVLFCANSNATVLIRLGAWLLIIPRSGIKVVRIGHAEKVSKRLEEVGANPYTMRGDAANRHGDRESHANRSTNHSNTFIILDIGHD